MTVNLANSLVPLSGLIAAGSSVLLILVSQRLTHRFGLGSGPERWLLVLRLSLLVLAGTLFTDGMYLMFRGVYYWPISIVREASLCGVAISVMRLIRVHREGLLPRGIFESEDREHAVVRHHGRAAR